MEAGDSHLGWHCTLLNFPQIFLPHPPALMNLKSQHWVLPSVRFKPTLVFFYCRLDVRSSKYQAQPALPYHRSYTQWAGSSSTSLPFHPNASSDGPEAGLFAHSGPFSVTFSIKSLVLTWPFAQCVSLGVYLKALFSIAHQVLQILC